MGGQRHTPAALPSGKTRYPFHRRLGRPQGRSGRVRKISPPSEFYPCNLQPVQSRYSGPQKLHGFITKYKYSFIKKNPTRCNNVSKFYYYILIWSSTCFRRHTAHHQEPKTTLAASGFLYVEGCWNCSWWTLSGTLCLTTSTNYTFNNLPRMKNQRLPVQF